MSQYKIT